MKSFLIEFSDGDVIILSFMKERIEFIDHIHHIILFKGLADVEYLKNNGKQYTFSNSTNTFVCRVFEKGCSIRSVSDMETELWLRPGKTGSVKVTSQQGTLALENQCDVYTLQPDHSKMEVKYTLEQAPFHFSLHCLPGKEESACL